MNVFIALALLWFAKRAEGRMAVINESEEIDNIREGRQSEAYYRRKPVGTVVMRPTSLEEINAAIRQEEQQLANTQARIERNRRFFSGR